MERFCAAVRASNPCAVQLYTEGQCYGFYLLLREVFGASVEPWYLDVPGHVISKIDGRFYDIKGRFFNIKKARRLNIGKESPHRWGPRDRRVLHRGEDNSSS